MADHLPGPRQFLDSLFAQLPRESTNQQEEVPSIPASCRLKALAGQDRRLFVTLHCLFPNELLPALDLLDRQRVTKLVAAEHPHGREGVSVYYVRSAQAPSRSRYQSAAGGQHYEVRLHAWNCSCPAFTFAAFGNTSSDVNISLSEEASGGSGESHECGFGGLRLGEEDTLPMCKHLMACFLVETCEDLLGNYIIKNTVSKEELAAWAAGWGE